MSRRTRPNETSPRAAADHAMTVASLDRYFAGFGLPEGRSRERLVQRFLEETLARRRAQPRADLATLAIEAAEQALSDWFARMLAPDSMVGHPPVLVGRAAYWSCGGPTRWPDALLDDAPPADLVEAMRQVVPLPVPPNEPASMPAQSLEHWSLRDLAGALPTALRDAAVALARRAVTS
jgi:hypothetical protein